MAQKKPQIHRLEPQPSVAKAVAANKAHVRAVNAASKRKSK
jgi:hypothetical protein